MSENCNGGSVVDGDISESAGGPVASGIPVGVSLKEFPPVRALRGFVRTPCVYLPRYDITPYLNRSKKSTPTINNQSPNKNLKGSNLKLQNEEVHLSRLSQKCVVKLSRDDLLQLKSSLTKNWKPTWRFDTDSDRSSCTDNEMASKCKICNKSYESEKKLLNHQRKKHIIYINSKPMKHVSFSDHVIIHEVKEYHKCRKCPKIFEDYRSLKQHTRQEHKKRKCYICHYCDKKFAERMIFKIHIKLHCDACGKLFDNKAKCINHKRTVCRVIKLHECKICGESFFNIMDLKDHSYEHNGPCFICDICKDQFDVKCSIAHHISFLHSKKRPRSLYSMLKVGNERLYLCNFCNKSSVERDIIESHVDKLPDLKNRAMTGYKDYYFCDVCMKKFQTEQEMVQHKWTHFLKITDNSQTPQSILKNAKPAPKTFNVNQELPLHFQPKLVLERLNLEERSSKPLELILEEGSSKPLEFYLEEGSSKPPQFILEDESSKPSEFNLEDGSLKPSEFMLEDGSSKPPEFIDIEIDIDPQCLTKAIVNKKSKKTLISKYQCEACGKYFSNNYCLNRHKSTQHGEIENLRCRVCEETFVWPSLLRSHKCIRLHHPEMPFDDARPEIHFDNQGYFDDLNIGENDDYLNAIDFEIPAPIVEMTEGETILNQTPKTHLERNQFQGYRLVMQEVPIEF